MATPARVLASVATGLETIACDEVADKLGSAAGAPSIRPGSLRLTVAREALPRLCALRCAGQLTLLVQEDVAFFSGRKGALQADVDRLRELGSTVDWVGGLLLRDSLLGRVQQQQQQPQQQPPVRFRVTCKRTTAVDGRDIGVQHGFSSVQAAAELGGAIAQAMGGRWVVSLKEFDLDITMAIAGRELTLGLKAAVAGAGAESSARTGRVGSTAGLMLGRTSLKVALAHAMSRLALGNEAGEATAAEGSGLTLDPMCGSGCIGLESASYWPKIVSLGGDVEPKEVRRLGRSLTTLRQSTALQLRPAGDAAATDGAVSGSGHASGSAAAHRCDAVLWDASRLPLRTGIIDSIATDLPWGQTVGTRVGNQTLYPAALKEFGRVLRPGGRCVLMTADRKAMAVALQGAGGEAQQHKEAASTTWVGACFERRKLSTALSGAKVREEPSTDACVGRVATPKLESEPEPEPEPERPKLVECRVPGGYVVQLRQNSSDELVYREMFGSDPPAAHADAVPEPIDCCYERYGIAPRAGDVWIDAGAHIGLFTLRALALGAAHVYCYEPHPDNFARLVANMELNGPAVAARVTLINAAVEQGEGCVDELATDGGGEQGDAVDECATIAAGTKSLFLAQRPHRGGKTNNYRHSLLAVAPGGSDVKLSSILVRTVSFAEVLRRHSDATAVKMDIEGAELEILSAAQPWNRVQKLCFEYTCRSQRLPALEETLREAGFTLSYPKELLFPRGSDGVVFATRSAAVAAGAADADARQRTEQQHKQTLCETKEGQIPTSDLGSDSGAGGSGDGTGSGSIHQPLPLETTEPDYLVNVSGRFAGVWVLQRTQTAWAELKPAPLAS